MEKQNKIVTAIVVLLIILGVGYFGYMRYLAPKAETETETASQVITAMFSCDEGKSITAQFNNATPSSVDLKLSDGREMNLPQAMSASGARYANADESIVFWNKGDTAFVTEADVTTFANCSISVQ